MNCPRRLGEIGPWDHEETDQDAWRDDNTCSFCGGLKPETALELIKRGWNIVTTDKNYKIYLDAGSFRKKVYLQHFTEEQLIALRR